MEAFSLSAPPGCLVSGDLARVFACETVELHGPPDARALEVRVAAGGNGAAPRLAAVEVASDAGLVEVHGGGAYVGTARADGDGVARQELGRATLPLLLKFGRLSTPGRLVLRRVAVEAAEGGEEEEHEGGGPSGTQADLAGLLDAAKRSGASEAMPPALLGLVSALAGRPPPPPPPPPPRPADPPPPPPGPDELVAAVSAVVARLGDRLEARLDRLEGRLGRIEAKLGA